MTVPVDHTSQTSSATPEIQQPPQQDRSSSDDLSADGALLPTRDVLARYRIHARTLDRWLIDPDLKFPKPVFINKRRYFRLRALQIFERESLRRLRQPA